jgi:hypothetical protein
MRIVVAACYRSAKYALGKGAGGRFDPGRVHVILVKQRSGTCRRDWSLGGARYSVSARRIEDRRRGNRATHIWRASAEPAAHVTAATRLCCATSRGDSHHCGGGDCEDFAMNLGFHNLTPLFSSDQPKLVPERRNFQY